VSRVGAVGREALAGANKEKKIGYIKCLYSGVIVPILLIVPKLRCNSFIGCCKT
jgi:hypothetical protein